MVKNKPHSADRFYKFNLKTLNIKFYQFFFIIGHILQFMETEIAETGQRKDSVVMVDEKIIHIIEFMSTPLTKKKLKAIFNYWDSIYSDPQYKDFELKCSVISIADPNHGVNIMEIAENTIFHVNVIFIKEMNGTKILSTLTDKINMNKELSYNEAISLLLLPDMDINISNEILIEKIIDLISRANIPDVEFKQKMYSCLIMLIARFYSDSEFDEMIEMLKNANKDPKIAGIIEKYGPGFDEIYLNGKTDGYHDGKTDGKLDTARKLLAKGLDINIISECTEISIEKLKKIKRNL